MCSINEDELRYGEESMLKSLMSQVKGNQLFVAVDDDDGEVLTPSAAFLE